MSASFCSRSTSSLPLLALAGLLALAPAAAQSNYPPDMDGARTETYRSVDGLDLRMWIFEPEGHRATDRRPAMVFFFGGGWRNGTPGQFERQCRTLAARGMVCLAADYRVQNRQGVKAKECITDAKAAMRWTRANAERLGVDPDRIGAGGGSAGGHLAAAVATVPGYDDPAGDKAVSPVPNALALFNPAAVLAEVPGRTPAPWAKRLPELEERFGAPAESISPYHQVRKGAPPAIVFHGKADTTVPYETAELFCEKMQAAGSRCELVGYDGAGHGFFNWGRGGGDAYRDTMVKLDAFLVSLGWLEEK